MNRLSHWFLHDLVQCGISWPPLKYRGKLCIVALNIEEAGLASMSTLATHMHLLTTQNGTHYYRENFMTDIYKAPEAELQEATQDGQYGSLENALAGNFQIRPIEAMKQAWNLLSGFKMTFWIAVIIYTIIAVVIEFALSTAFGYEPFADEFGPMKLVGSIISTFVLGPLSAGLYMLAIKHSVGTKVEVGELFEHFDKIVPIFIVTALMYVAIGLGFVLLIVPGIYLLVCFAFALPLVFEKGMSPIEALSTSRKVVHRQWFQTAGLVLICVIVIIAGFLALLVGAVWAVPLSMLAFALVYRDVFGVEEKTLQP